MTSYTTHNTIRRYHGYSWLFYVQAYLRYLLFARLAQRAYEYNQTHRRSDGMQELAWSDKLYRVLDLLRGKHTI